MSSETESLLAEDKVAKTSEPSLRDLGIDDFNVEFTTDGKIQSLVINNDGYVFKSYWGFGSITYKNVSERDFQYPVRPDLKSIKWAPINNNFTIVTKGRSEISLSKFKEEYPDIYNLCLSTISQTDRKAKCEQTASAKIRQIESVLNEPAMKKWVARVLLGVFFLAFLGGSIALGSSLFHVGFLTASQGIAGIPLEVTTALGISCSSVMGLYVLAGAVTLANKHIIKSDNKILKTIEETLSNILRKDSELFLSSNVNDLSYGVYSILFALTLLSVLHVSPLLMGCLSYPAGALFVYSGLYQIKESLIGLSNAIKSGDKEAILNESLNLLNGVAVATLGGLTAMGMFLNPATIALNALNGILSIAVAALGYNNSKKQKEEIEKIKDNDIDAIKKYLENKLSLSALELSQIREEVYKKSKKEIEKEVEERIKEASIENKEHWKKVKRQLDSNLKYVKEELIKKRIQLLEMAKKDSFESVVSALTLQNTLKVLNGNITEDNKIKEVFKAVKSEIETKRKVDIAKTFVLYLPLFVFAFVALLPYIAPALFVASSLTAFNVIYSFAMGSVVLLSLGINIFPRFRNRPPKALNEDLLDGKSVASTESKGGAVDVGRAAEAPDFL